MFGQGGLQQMGIAWGCGPAKDFSKALHIFAVPTVEMATFYNSSEALYRWGATRDWRYFEWRIQYPLRKANPDQKARMTELYKNAGIPVTQA